MKPAWLLAVALAPALAFADAAVGGLADGKLPCGTPMAAAALCACLVKAHPDLERCERIDHGEVPEVRVLRQGTGGASYVFLAVGGDHGFRVVGVLEIEQHHGKRESNLELLELRAVTPGRVARLTYRYREGFSWPRLAERDRYPFHDELPWPIARDLPRENGAVDTFGTETTTEVWVALGREPRWLAVDRACFWQVAKASLRGPAVVSEPRILWRSLSALDADGMLRGRPHSYDCRAPETARRLF